MLQRWPILLGIIGIMVGLTMPVQAFHLPTVNEGLLSQKGCYVGVYLGGNQGANNEKCVNFFKKAQQFPYETQYLDKPDSYGEKKSTGLPSIDTGVSSFRHDVDTIQQGTGAKQVLFSRYYDMTFYPDNNYGKIPYTESPAPYVWAEKVIQQGGVPVISLDPYGLAKDGVLDLSVKNIKSMTGKEILQDLGKQLKTITEKYRDENGKPATVIIWFAHEFNTAPIVNPEANDHVDSRNKKAFRSVFREAYSILHQYGGDGVQVAWAGNIAQTREDRMYYWPAYDDSMHELAQDSVDWVGMTWYPWPDGPATLDRFQGFYDFYARDRQHPFIFMETSADGWGDPATELSLKTNHVNYLYKAATLSRYPNIKGIVWFNVVKGEQKTPSDLALVTKNFLIPDGQWDNHGQSTSVAGDVYSASDPARAMLPLYPAVMTDPYFISSAKNTVTANFSAGPTSGDAPLNVTFTDTSTGNPASWLWNFGDGSTSTDQNPVHPYQKSGTFDVSLKATNNRDFDTKRKPDYINVNTSPPPSPISASFLVNVNRGMAPLSVRFTDTSTGDPTSWFWNFGDGSTSTGQNPVHVYQKPGTFDVSLKAMHSRDFDTKRIEDFITVEPASSLQILSASFRTNVTNGTMPLAVKFLDTSSGNPVSWLWNFGDGSTATDQNPVHVYQKSGTFDVSLRVMHSRGFATLRIPDYITISAG